MQCLRPFHRHERAAHHAMTNIVVAIVVIAGFRHAGALNTYAGRFRGDAR
jgi:hypothetical protein